MKNRVAHLVALRRIELCEEDTPELKEGEVLIGIKAVGICGSDIHYFLEGGLGSFKQKLPMPMGHEPTGVVVESRAREFKKGDRVAIEPGRVCLLCPQCLKGKHNLCKNVRFMGAGTPGALADYVIVHKTQLAKIPAKVPFEIAALIEPLGIGLHAVNLIQPKSAERAIIVGAGPIGLCLLKVLERIGLTEIYLVDTLPYRVRFAKQLGAADAFLFKDAAEKLATLTEKEGAAYVFDTASTQDAITLCGEVVGVGGTIGLIGIPTKDTIHYNPHRLRVKEVRIQNVRRSNQTLVDCIKLFAEDKTLAKIVTHRFPLEKVQKGFELVSAQKDNVIKCIITND